MKLPISDYSHDSRIKDHVEHGKCHNLVFVYVSNSTMTLFLLNMLPDVEIECLNQLNECVQSIL